MPFPKCDCPLLDGGQAATWASSCRINALLVEVNPAVCPKSGSGKHRSGRRSLQHILAQQRLTQIRSPSIAPATSGVQSGGQCQDCHQPADAAYGGNNDHCYEPQPTPGDRRTAWCGGAGSVAKSGLGQTTERSVHHLRPDARRLDEFPRASFGAYAQPRQTGRTRSVVRQLLLHQPGLHTVAQVVFHGPLSSRARIVD